METKFINNLNDEQKISKFNFNLNKQLYLFLI